MLFCQYVIMWLVLLKLWFMSLLYLNYLSKPYYLGNPNYHATKICWPCWGCANSKYVCLPEQTLSDYAFQLASIISCIVIVGIVIILEMIIRDPLCLLIISSDTKRTQTSAQEEDLLIKKIHQKFVRRELFKKNQSKNEMILKK